MKRRLAIGILSSLLVLSACTAPPETDDSSLVTPPGSSVDEDDSGEVAETFNTSDGRVPAEGNIDQSGSIRTVPKSRFQETIVEYRTDEFGEYAVTKLAYPSIDSVDNKGVSKTTLTSALEFYTDFLSTEVLDSIALDNYANYDRWVKEVAPKYVAAEFFDEVVNGQENGQDAGIIFNSYSGTRDVSYRKNLIPVLLRDGGPRLFNKHIFGLKAENVEGAVYIWGMGAATLMFDDASYLKWDQIVFGPGGEGLERMNDGKNQASQLNFQVGLSLLPDGDSWRIAGYSNSFNLNSADDMEPLPERLADWRTAIQ